MSNDRLKMFYGYMLLLILCVLAVAFGMGQVEEKTSYGLMPLVVAISNLAAQWAQWAFSRDKTIEGKHDDHHEV